MKKTISLLLALCMLLSVIPVLGMNALAGGGTTLTIFSEDFEKMDEFNTNEQQLLHKESVYDPLEASVCSFLLYNLKVQLRLSKLYR